MSGLSEFIKTINTPSGQFNYYDLRELISKGHDIESIAFYNKDTAGEYPSQF